MLARPGADQVRLQRHDELRRSAAHGRILAAVEALVVGGRHQRSDHPPHGGRGGLHEDGDVLDNGRPVCEEASRLLARDLEDDALSVGGGKARRVGLGVIRDLEKDRRKHLPDDLVDVLRVVHDELRHAAPLGLVADKRRVFLPRHVARKKDAAGKVGANQRLGDHLGVIGVGNYELLKRLLDRDDDRRRAVLVDAVAVAARALYELGELLNLLLDVDDHRRALASGVVAQRRDAQAVGAVVYAQVRRQAQHNAGVGAAVLWRVRLRVLAGVNREVAHRLLDLGDRPPKGRELGRERLERGEQVQEVDAEHHGELVLQEGLLSRDRHARRVDHLLDHRSAVGKDLDERNAVIVCNVLDVGCDFRSGEVLALDDLHGLVDV